MYLILRIRMALRRLLAGRRGMGLRRRMLRSGMLGILLPRGGRRHQRQGCERSQDCAAPSFRPANAIHVSTSLNVPSLKNRPGGAGFH
jgi:hypothetical protein